MGVDHLCLVGTVADTAEPAKAEVVSMMRLGGFCEKAPVIGTRHVFEILPNHVVVHYFAAPSPSSDDVGTDNNE
ncbi:MAG: hypothetical protein GY822_27350 [Deltaproteobacteria bacterium]|nr:hypothetical protein [Deltaproteobacteria bacterium]